VAQNPAQSSSTEMSQPTKPILSPVTDQAIVGKLQQTLAQIAENSRDRKDELVDMLSDEQPSKSRLVELSYIACIWWEGCYYCQDDQGQWYQVKCFI